MYRFRIYRNPSVPSLNGTFSDNTRYEIDDYAFERTINPIYSELVFKWEKGDRAFYRKTLEGSFSLIGEDYGWAVDIRENFTEGNKYRVLIIEEDIDGEWVESYRGFFSIITGEWDLNKCSVKFAEHLVWDRYNVILENIEREKNMMDLFSWTVYYTPTEYPYEEYVYTTVFGYNGADPCSAGVALTPSASEYFLTGTTPWGSSLEKYTLYSREIIGFIEAPTWSSFDYEWQIKKVYRREFVNQVNNPAGNFIDSGQVVEGSGDGVKHWVREYLNNLSPSYTTETWTELIHAGTNPNIISCYATLSRSSYVNPTSTGSLGNDRARLFAQAIAYLVTDLPTLNAIIRSDFLTLTENPVTGEASKVNWLFMFQLSDIRDTSDPATKGIYSLKNTEEWLGILQLAWYIDDDGYFVVEHEKFFDQGLSYDGNTVGLNVFADPDLQKQAKSTSVISYINTSLPRIEDFSVPYASGDDFFGSPIVYHGNMSNWNEDNIISHSTRDLSMDIGGAASNGDAGDNGFIIVATETIGFERWVTVDTGALTQTPVQNAPLSIANIQNDYWKWGRPLPEGVMNKQYTVFESAENNVKQEEFSVAYCGVFDPYKLVRTEYGDGKVLSASKSLVDGKLSLSLSYES